MHTICHYLLPIDREEWQIEMPAGTDLFYLTEWRGLRVVFGFSDPSQPTVTRLFRMVASTDFNQVEVTPEIIDEIRTKGKCLGSFNQHGRVRLWLVFDMGEMETPFADVTPEPEETKELDAFGDDINTVRYWHHPESSCVGRLKPGEKHPDDPFVHPIDEKTYIRLSAEYDEL